jgi:NADPH:quinone reductase-like Zn-dependent oxidoreductase
LVGVDTMKLTPRDVAAIAQKLCSGFEAGGLKPPAVETVPFGDAIQAYERIASGKTNAKQVLTFSTDQRS